MLLQGNLKEFSLPNIFQLVKMSAKSGALTIRRGEESGKIFFRHGLIYYAYSAPQLLPIGERLVKAGAISAKELKEALAEQKKAGESARIGTILLQSGVIDRGTLEQAVREQIQDTAFNFFSWSEGDFEFSADEHVTDEDILVEMTVETVIMEGCRRIDEWELIFEHLGSLERVPHLAYSERVEERGEITLTAEEWRVLVHIDGRADINTILRDCGLDRFHGAKVIYSLFSSGLITVSEAAIEDIGSGLSIAVRGPIDIYNEVFLNTLTDANLVKQLRVEMIDDKEVEIPVLAGQVQASNGGSDGAGAEGEDVLVFTVAASSPEQAWRRFAARELRLGAARERERPRQPACHEGRPGVRARPRRRAVRRRHLHVDGRRRAQRQAGGQGPRRRRRRAGACLPAARSRLGPRRRQGRPGARRALTAATAPPACQGAAPGGRLQAKTGSQPFPHERTRPHVLPQLPHAPAPADAGDPAHVA